MTATVEIVLARGEPTFGGELFGWWIIYGEPLFAQVIGPGLMVPMAKLLTAYRGADE